MLLQLCTGLVLILATVTAAWIHEHHCSWPVNLLAIAGLLVPAGAVAALELELGPSAAWGLLGGWAVLEILLYRLFHAWRRGLSSEGTH